MEWRDAARTVVDALVRLEVHVVVLERGHALSEQREDVPLLDHVVYRQTCHARGR